MVRPWNGRNYPPPTSDWSFFIDKMAFCIRNSQETERHAPPVPVRHPDPEEILQAAYLPLLGYKMGNSEDMRTWSTCRDTAVSLNPSHLTRAYVTYFVPGTAYFACFVFYFSRFYFHH